MTLMNTVKAEMRSPTVLLPTESVDPASLPNIYGLLVTGNCMAPDIPDGSVVECSRMEPYRVGDFIILWFRPDVVHGGAPQAKIKRLVLAPPPELKFPYKEHPESECRILTMVEMLNPRRQLMIECQNLLAIHKCMGVIPAENARALNKRERAFLARRSQPVGPEAKSERAQ